MKDAGLKIIIIISLLILIALISLIWQMDRKINLLNNQLAVLNLKNCPATEEKSAASISTSTLIPAPTQETLVSKDNNSNVEIPASIIFSTLSSPLLLPQSPLTVTIEKFTKSPTEKTLILHLKVFTNETSSYSSLEISNLFALIDLEKSEIQKPARGKGSFNSLPPHSATPGQVIFNLEELDKDIFILRVGADENAKFYELDFNKRTYHETSVG